MTDVFEIIKDQYFTLDTHYDQLYSNCMSDEEKAGLKRDYIIARSNYRKSLNLNFDENDSVVKGLIDELDKLNDRIKKDIESLDKVTDILSAISESVKIASSIIVLVISLV
jgi:hypothetical protein